MDNPNKVSEMVAKMLSMVKDVNQKINSLPIEERTKLASIQKDINGGLKDLKTELKNADKNSK